MAAVQQAAYVAMSRGHSYRWRVGRRSPLKHNLTFPPHLELYCYESQREIILHHRMAVLKISIKGKLLTSPGIPSRAALNQAVLFDLAGCDRGGLLVLTDACPARSPRNRSMTSWRRWGSVVECRIAAHAATDH